MCLKQVSVLRFPTMSDNDSLCLCRCTYTLFFYFLEPHNFIVQEHHPIVTVNQHNAGINHK